IITRSTRTLAALASRLNASSRTLPAAKTLMCARTKEKRCTSESQRVASSGGSSVFGDCHSGWITGSVDECMAFSDAKNHSAHTHNGMRAGRGQEGFQRWGELRQRRPDARQRVMIALHQILYVLDDLLPVVGVRLPFLFGKVTEQRQGRLARGAKLRDDLGRRVIDDRIGCKTLIIVGLADHHTGNALLQGLGKAHLV